MERLQGLADGICVSTPQFGEMLRMDAMTRGACWWRSLPDGRNATAVARDEVGELARVPRVAG